MNVENNKLPRAIVLIGKPGSGKSTQAKMISEHYGIGQYSMGSEFRALADSKTDLGDKVKEIIEKGSLLPSWLPIYMFQKKLLTMKDGECVIFEGLGRKVDESKLFDEILRFLDWESLVFYLHIPDELSVERILKRNERADDTLEVVQRRLEKYHQYTDTSVDYYRDTNQLIEIDGSQSVDNAFKDIKKIIDEYQK